MVFSVILGGGGGGVLFNLAQRFSPAIPVAQVKVFIPSARTVNLQCGGPWGCVRGRPIPCPAPTTHINNFTRHPVLNAVIKVDIIPTDVYRAPTKCRRGSKTQSTEQGCHGLRAQGAHIRCGESGWTLINKQNYQRVMTGGRHGDREGHIEQRGQGRALLS